MNKSLLFILNVIFIITISNLYSFTHIHPVPSLPKDLNPFTGGEVFSVNAIMQIHNTLFEMEDNKPIPRLVEDFTVSKDQRTYYFKLKPLLFHNGQPLTFEDARYSFEQVLKFKSLGYEKISSIVGYNDFIRGKTKHLEGIIKGENDKEFIVKLAEPRPLLIYFLTEYGFSIVPHSGIPNIGLGKYKVKKNSLDSFSLERVNKNIKNIPAIIEYKKVNQTEAIKGFINGKYHDLFAYPIVPNDIEQFESIANVQLIYAPRTYAFVLNTRALQDKKIREFIFNQINIKAFIDECYPGNTATNSIIPPGFLGYVDKNEENKQNQENANSPKPSSLKIDIAFGVGSEKCVAKNLKNFLHSIKNVTIRVLDTSDILDNWYSNKIDAFFAYWDAENTLDFFQSFNPSAKLQISVSNDNRINTLLEDYNKTSLSLDKNKKAIELSKYILSLKTFFPLFHPKQYLIYSHKYKKINFGVKSANFIHFDKFILKENI